VSTDFDNSNKVNKQLLLLKLLLFHGKNILRLLGRDDGGNVKEVVRNPDHLSNVQLLETHAQL